MSYSNSKCFPPISGVRCLKGYYITLLGPGGKNLATKKRKKVIISPFWDVEGKVWRRKNEKRSSYHPFETWRKKFGDEKKIDVFYGIGCCCCSVKAIIKKGVRTCAKRLQTWVRGGCRPKISGKGTSSAWQTRWQFHQNLRRLRAN